MTEANVIEFTVQAAMLVLVLSLLPISVAVLVGLFISLLQALTQIQEQTLSFAVKLIAVALTLLFSMNWIGSELYNYTLTILEMLPTVRQ